MSILLKDENATMLKHTSQTQPASPNHPLFTSLLSELLYSKVASKWEQIGAVLGVTAGILEAIKSEHSGDYQICFVEMLQEWMKQVDPPPSWSVIINAIENIPGCDSLAQTLRNEHLPEKGDNQGAKATNLGGPSTLHAHKPGLYPVLSGGKFIHWSNQ